MKRTSTQPKDIELSEQLTLRLSFRDWALGANKTQKQKTVKMKHKNFEAGALSGKTTQSK
jgi:hypothetical protein